MFWLCKVVAEYETIAPLTASSEEYKIIFQKITELIENGKKEFDETNFTTAANYFAEALVLFERLDISDISELKYNFYLWLIDIAEKRRDYPKIIEYCSLAMHCASGYNLSVVEKRGKAYLEIGDIDRALADFQEYNKWNSIYGAIEKQIDLELTVEDLITELFGYYCLYCFDPVIADNIFQAIKYLVISWDELQ